MIYNLRVGRKKLALFPLTIFIYIDNSKGYVKGNIWIISFRANTIKNSASLEELEKMVYAIKNILQTKEIQNTLDAPLVSVRLDAKDIANEPFEYAQ